MINLFNKYGDKKLMDYIDWFIRERLISEVLFFIFKDIFNFTPPKKLKTKPSFSIATQKDINHLLSYFHPLYTFTPLALSFFIDFAAVFMNTISSLYINIII